tara:strand:+ start:1732 stop:2085 length:354 start_codon:yes stop_codon:yes gene_type:complete
MKEETMGKSIFLKLFGESPINKVLDFLIIFNKFDYSMIDISEKAEVGYTTLKSLLPELVKRKILIITRISGKSKMYGLNNEEEIVKRFRDFYWDVTNMVGRKKLGLEPQKQPVIQKV